MSSRNFRDLLEGRAIQGKFLSVGIDPDITKIPEHLKKGTTRDVFNAFGRAIVDATKDVVCAFKPNSAFYEMYGEEGYAALSDICKYILETAPEVPMILDAKRADIGNTNEGYARSAFDYLKVDAITVHPYLGREALGPFINDEYAAAVERLETLLRATSQPIDVICTMKRSAESSSDSGLVTRCDKLLGSISPYIGTIALVSPLTENVFALARTMFVTAISITGLSDRIHVTASLDEARHLIGYLRGSRHEYW